MTTYLDVPQSEGDALVVLYNAGGGAGWTNNTNWVSGQTVGDWHGVTVLGGHVRQLSITSNNGSGDISSFAPGDLPQMTHLLLYSNSFSGNLSSWDVSNLTYIHLWNNSFSVAPTTTPASGLYHYTIEENGMTETNVDAFIETIWNNRANWTDATPELHVGGSNAAPSGVYQNGYPAPLTGLEMLHDLMNDDGTGSFSNDLSASSSFAYFEVGSSTPAANDYAYFGAAYPFFSVVLNIGTAASTTGVTTELEYWDGAAWASAGYPSNTFCDSDFETGMIVLAPVVQDDWAKTTINGKNLYWLRVKLKTVTTWTTSPAQSGQVVYLSDDDYIELADTQIDGDVPAKLLIKAENWGGTTFRNLVLGVKSRGLTNFTSRLNAGSDSINPGDWAISYGDDTATESNPLGPDGYMAKCDFTTDQTMDDRVTWINTVSSEVKDWEGEYHVYARMMQDGGSDGDISVRLDMELGKTNYNGEAVNTGAMPSNAPTIVSLGQFTILSSQLRGSDNASSDFVFELSAKSDGGTSPDLYILDLIFIPIDEWAMATSSATEQPYVYGNCVEIDNGIKREGATIVGRIDNEVEGPITVRGTLPVLEPSRQSRLYALAYLSDSSPYAYNHHHIAISIYPHERWSLLRGAE